jgi:hypothetical protein
MKRHFFAIAIGALISGFVLPVAANNVGIASFDGGIGVTPAALSNGAFVPNDVFAVPPGGRPWVIKTLRGKVDANGTISVKGEGLVLAGGNAVGTAGPITQVVATIFCDGQPHHSPVVPIQRNGDFEIDGMLTTTPPSPCNNPVLLIRNAAGGTPGAWFAAGLPK